ncbi:MAG: type III secretion HpaP family protein [Acetobacteraceae bacterium]
MSGVTPPKGRGALEGAQANEHSIARDRKPAPPSDADAERLRRLLSRREADDAAEDSEAEEQDDQPDSPLSAAEAMLAALGSVRQAPPLEAPPAIEATQPVGRSELTDLADRIVQEVQVGQRADGENELRITLNQEIFGQTEVNIALHQGALELRIDTLSEEIKGLLQTNASGFADDLAKRLGRPVVLEVNAPGQSEQAAGQDQGDNRRSRGYDQILRYVAEGSA